MTLYSISVQKNFTKQSTSLIMNSNKLFNTINIVSNKIIVKDRDVNFIFTILERNLIPFTIKQLRK